MIFMTLIKLLIIVAVLLVLRIFFPSLVKGFKRVMFVVIAAMILFALVVMYS